MKAVIIADGLSFWKGKRILITGHTGFKGSWLCKILEVLGADIVGYALSPSKQPNMFDICKPKISSVIGDIRDFNNLLRVFKESSPEIVIHMAAQPLVLDAYKEPKYTYDVNVMGTVAVMECVRLSGGVKSLLNVTTDKVYLNLERPEGYREDEQLNGFDPYSNSKSCSELVTSSYNNSFLKLAGTAVSTARSGNVIGGGDFSENRLIPDCAKASALKETIVLRSPDAVRPYLHVLDTLFAYLKIVQKQYEDTSFSGAYNIGPGENNCAANRELADYFCKEWGNSARWEYVPAQNPHESEVLRLDCRKIERVLGWTPHWDVKHAVKETALWYKLYYEDGDVNTAMLRQIEEFLQ